MLLLEIRVYGIEGLQICFERRIITIPKDYYLIKYKCVVYVRSRGLSLIEIEDRYLNMRLSSYSTKCFFFLSESNHKNLHESLFFVVQNPFLNVEMDSAC
jgi:hypothetical protein